MVWYLAIHCWLCCQSQPDIAMLFGCFLGSPKTNLVTCRPGGPRGIYVAFTSLGFSGATARNAGCPLVINRFNGHCYHIKMILCYCYNCSLMTCLTLFDHHGKQCQSIFPSPFCLVEGLQSARLFTWRMPLASRSWNAVGIWTNYWQSHGASIASHGRIHTHSMHKWWKFIKTLAQLYNSLIYFLSFQPSQKWKLPATPTGSVFCTCFQYLQSPPQIIPGKFVHPPGEATVAVRISSMLPVSSVSPPSVSEQLGSVMCYVHGMCIVVIEGECVRLEKVGHDFTQIHIDM